MDTREHAVGDELREPRTARSSWSSGAVTRLATELVVPWREGSVRLLGVARGIGPAVTAVHVGVDEPGHDSAARHHDGAAVRWRSGSDLGDPGAVDTDPARLEYAAGHDDPRTGDDRHDRLSIATSAAPRRPAASPSFPRTIRGRR